MRLISTATLAVLATFAVACGGEPTASTASASAVKEAPPPPPKTSSSAGALSGASITVDDMGPYIAGERPILKENGGMEKLKRIVGSLGIKPGSEVEMVVLKKAKISDVVTVVRELGDAGAAKVKIKHETRADLPKELVVVPQKKLSGDTPPCAVVAIISNKLETDVWAISGGTGKKHVKGFAGPDLSNAGETLKKDLKKCGSKVAFFTAEEPLDWDLAHQVGGAIMVNDEEKKIESLVLLDETPVPGRPVKL